MTRRREFENLREEIEAIAAQRDTALDVIADADVPDEEVETLIQASRKRLDGEERTEEEQRTLQRADAVESA